MRGGEHQSKPDSLSKIGDSYWERRVGGVVGTKCTILSESFHLIAIMLAISYKIKI